MGIPEEHIAIVQGLLDSKLLLPGRGELSINNRVDAELYEEFKFHAKKLGFNLKAALASALLEWINNHGGEFPSERARKKTG